MGTLHLVPVPLSESVAAADVLAAPVLRVVREARYFLAENARSARAFLKSAGHPVPIAQLHIVEIGHAPPEEYLDPWLAPLREDADASGVLVSEAGCPGIADPGAGLVARAHATGVRVVPWTGPSSLVLALMASGMNGQQFCFLGYLPQDMAALRERLVEVQRAAQRGVTQLFIETPYRNQRLFEAILQTCDPALRLCVACDLTTPDAFIASRTVAAWRAARTPPPIEKRPAVFLLMGN